MLSACRDAIHFGALQVHIWPPATLACPISLNEEVDVVMRVQLLRIDARQHDLIIAN
jgi:hypothetical protein